ncbi:Protein of unknown function [Gryllus bimaculatus]|nr:Protein of unknown function [Gryllus bimaculatus]
MDFIEYAKWGIRVKEEPGTLGPFHQDNHIKNNIGGLQRGWMCKFPCDAQGALDTPSATDNLPQGLLEPVEPSPVNFLGVQTQEYFNLQDSDKFTGSTVAEGTIHQNQPIHIIQQDVFMKEYDVNRSTRQEKNFVTSLTDSKESLKDDEKHMLDAVLNERCDNSEDLPRTAGEIHQREFVQCFPKNTASKRPNEETFIVKNQNEILCSSDMELLFEAPENSVIELVKNSGRTEMSMNVEDNLSREIESLTEEHIATAHQENNNDFRISEISSFECPDCGEVLKSFNSFITHMNSHIIQQRENIDTVQCENCIEKFDDNRSLSLHKKECNCEKESNLVPFQKNHHQIYNDNSNGNINNEMCSSVNCFETDSSLSNKQFTSRDNPELAFSSHCQEVSLKKFPEQSRHYNDLSSCSPKQRQQAYSEECSSSETLKSTSNWTMQNLGAADDAFDVSWSSEIKCRDKREGRNLGSVSTLSLRLFRFRRPRVVVKRANVPVRSQSVIKTLNSRLGDSVSNNMINTKSVCQVENPGNLKQLSTESETNRVNKIPKPDSKVVSCSNIVQLCGKPKHSEKEWHCARQQKSTDADRCYSQANLTSSHSEPQNVESLICDTPFSFSAKVSQTNKKSDEHVNVSSKFPTEDTKVRSNLKIKIKPVVVLDRLRSLNFNLNQSSQENPSKSVQGVSVQKNISKGMNISIGSSVFEKCEAPSVETNSKKLETTIGDQSARHDPCHNAINHCENSLAHLEKRYGIKKCYVKLKRISVEPCDLRKIVKRNRNETGREMKTCGKIKLRRMSSKMWTVSSCTSALENTEVAEYTEDGMKSSNWLCVAEDTELSSDQEVHNEIYGQRSKKCVGSKDPSICSSESAEETLNYIRRGKHMKHYRSECTCCQKIFFDEKDLAQHLETHLSGYKCPNCSARFHFVMELHAHEAGCSLASLLDCHKAKSRIKPCQVIL